MLNERINFIWNDEGEGLKKVFSDGSMILKKWGIIGLLKGYIGQEYVSRLVDRRQKRWAVLVNETLKKAKKFGCWVSAENDAR